MFSCLHLSISSTDSRKPGNLSNTAEFLPLGLSGDPELQPLLFCLFLSMYLVTVLGNLLITLAIICDPHLHTPMYFFLSNLSFVDICFTSTIIPKMLVNIQTQSKSISYTVTSLICPDICWTGKWSAGDDGL